MYCISVTTHDIDIHQYYLNTYVFISVTTRDIDIHQYYVNTYVFISVTTHDIDIHQYYVYISYNTYRYTPVLCIYFSYNT